MIYTFFPDVALNWFEKALACCNLKTHGATIKLIGAMISAVTVCCFDVAAISEKAIGWLDQLQDQLPAARPNMASLRAILVNPSPEQIDTTLRLLPFNYH
jgi:hypothetical protein